jgi:drug/metabolite transporter (DMT)-like permease
MHRMNSDALATEAGLMTRGRRSGVVAAAAAMTAVGSGVTVSASLTDYPLFTAQTIRYGLAALILGGGIRATGRRLARPAAADWVWLVALAATGLALFNVAIVRAVDRAEPAAVAVIVSAVPVVLLGGDALRRRQLPSSAAIAGALLVVVGAAVVHGGGRTSTAGMAWSLVALICEASFTLLAVPVLARLGPLSVSAHACWIATILLAITAVAVDGADMLPRPDIGELLAITHLAVVLTAVAFVLWYRAVERLGAGTAGLFAGLIPVAAAVVGVVPGLTTITVTVLGGSTLVGVGIAIGIAGDRTAATRPGAPRGEPSDRTDKGPATVRSSRPWRSPGAEDVLGSIGTEPGTDAVALTAGFQRGSLVAAGFSVAGALAAGLLLRRAERGAASVTTTKPVPAQREAITDPAPGMRGAQGTTGSDGLWRSFGRRDMDSSVSAMDRLIAQDFTDGMRTQGSRLRC